MTRSDKQDHGVEGETIEQGTIVQIGLKSDSPFAGEADMMRGNPAAAAEPKQEAFSQTSCSVSELADGQQALAPEDVSQPKRETLFRMHLDEVSGRQVSGW